MFNKILVSCVGLALVFFSLIILFPKTDKKVSIEGASWEVLLEYDTLSDALSLKKLDMVRKIIAQDNTNASTSEYTLKVYGRGNKKLYSSRILINTAINYNVLAYPPGKNENEFDILKQPKKIETLLYVPYFPGSEKMLVYKNLKKILEVDLPDKNILVNTQKISQSCNPLTTVFVSDGYSDMSRFRQDVEWIKQTLLSVEPFSSKKEIFDFKMLENTLPYGCVASYSCVSKATQIRQQVASVYPNAKKIIVLVNRPIMSSADGNVGGVNTSYVSFFSNASDGVGRNLIPPIAVHEFLGHGVSGLDERYVNAGTSQLAPGPNCSSGVDGKLFWKEAGVNTVYKGCAYENYYAPGPLDCLASTNPTLFSAGSSSTAMSAAGCGGVQFDRVERYWIEKNILPKYSACSTQDLSVTPTPSVSTQVCDPESSSSSLGVIDIADLRLARREIAGLEITNRASCLTNPSTDTTAFADLRKIRRIITGLDSQ